MSPAWPTWSHVPREHVDMLWREFESEKEKSVDDWLPITSSRNAKWWYSAFHNVTAMVGASMLTLPYAMSGLGWGPDIVVLILSWIITQYTLWQMVEMHEMKFHDTVCSDCKQIKLTYFIKIFASVHFVLSQLPNFNTISGISFGAAIMSLSYSTIAWGASLDKGKVENVDYGYKGSSQAETTFNFLSVLGDVAFAYAGHNVVLEIQVTITSTPKNPSKKPMWKGVIIAVIVALCYFPVAIVGYWVFDNNVEDNIFITLNRPKWLIAMANMMVVVHVIAFTMFIGVTYPFFGALLGFFGGFALAPTTFFVSSHYET
ncbi:lysine histidine transporter 1 [Canna indica]|uniref:Lysine histidine transporter 1 n=1 Tax=Canna indica TaxID=4628 RepID=A0AAQ3K8Q6_9LILI|nr:lysine histidine transporter 1 [Canna indica]